MKSPACLKLFENQKKWIHFLEELKTNALKKKGKQKAPISLSLSKEVNILENEKAGRYAPPTTTPWL